MSKKDFIALADIIRMHNAEIDREGNYVRVADRFNESQIATLASFCAEQNPMFKRERWLDYINGKCGKNGGAIKQTV